MSINEISIWVDNHNLLTISVVIPILSAIIAAIASWYATSKALKVNNLRMNFDGTLKVAEFRQSWINSLRDEMAEFQSYGILPDSDPSKERNFYKLGTKIELLMNPADPDYQNLQNQMYSFLSVANGDTSDKYIQNPEFITLCQKILKREWDRLKADIENGKKA